MQNVMQNKRQARLVSSYWIRDPVAWAATYTAYIQELEKNGQATGMTIVRTKLKAHPRRNRDYPYRVSITARISDPAAANRFMQGCKTRAGSAGISTGTIVNTRYD